MPRPARLPDIPLFEDPAFDPATIADPTARTFVEAMRRDGGAVIDLGDAARALCDPAVAQTEDYFEEQGARRVQDAWRKSKAVRDLALLPAFHDLLAAAYGRKSFAFQTLNFRVGSQQELHSDIIHFSSRPEHFMCGVWIALEDILPGSGPVTWYPGSHRLDPLTMRAVGVNSTRPGPQDYERHFLPRFAEQVTASGIAPRELMIPKGYAFVWAANLAHGGSPIRQMGSTRRSLVVHCYFDGSLFFTPMTSDVEGGRLSVRLPPDVRTGRWRWPRRNGRRVWPKLRTIAGALMRDVINAPHLF